MGSADFTLLLDALLSHAARTFCAQNLLLALCQHWPSSHPWGFVTTLVMAFLLCAQVLKYSMLILPFHQGIELPDGDFCHSLPHLQKGCACTSAAWTDYMFNIRTLTKSARSISEHAYGCESLCTWEHISIYSCTMYMLDLTLRVRMVQSTSIIF